MDPKKSGGQVENSIQPKYAVFGTFVLEPKRGSKWDPKVPKGPPWAHRAHMEAEGRPNGGLGAKPPEKGPIWAHGGPEGEKKRFFPSGEGPT